MQRYLAAAVIPLLVGMVLFRVLLMRRAGIKALHFGSMDKKDFLIPPFALFYFYAVFAAAFDLPFIGTRTFFHSAAIAWLGVLLCLFGLLLLMLSLMAFGKSFRIGIDVNHADELVTTDIFFFSRNPIYVAFGLVLLGQFLVFPNGILLFYLAAGFWLLHRQVLREEEFMKKRYGQEYAAYCSRVRRYL